MEHQKISVLYFLNRFPLPSETFVIDQICGLMDRGIDISIISLIKGDYDNMHEKVVEYGLDKKTVYLSEQTSHKFFSRIFSLGTSLFNPKIIALLNFFKYGSVARNLLLPLVEKKKEKKSYDFIIAHFGTAGVTAMKIIDANVLEGKLIPVFHGADISKKKNLETYQADYQLLFKKSFALFPISELWKNKLIELGAEDNKILVNRMGIDVDKFDFKNSSQKEDKIFRIVSVARMVEKKGIDDAIQAMSLLKKSTEIRFKYDLVGGGPLLDTLKEQANKLGLTDIIKFHGVQTHSGVKKLLGEADIFLLPSKIASDGDMEGIPVSLMESMSSGIVTLSTFHSGIPELIEHEVQGFLVPENSPSKIAEQLKRIVEGEYKLSEIRLNALDKVQGEFNQKNAYDQMYNFMNENLKKSTPCITKIK
ncbi:glycosyltransferase [Alteromonas sp. 1_MG-2023]|uniref:glycosyltransferase n=1 Tax=Alteromonas sp. 1_MG-2023 TaxID=3062669 RepID=UPI0026E1E52C|nr:glycosyltransferase [Alteromonas sp. 1_MG-2023]MDO6567499.1 glycosyltransferase [Alteromonas sp. 1_MG-2023]